MEDARQFNIRDEDGHLLCPACGLPGFVCEVPYDARGGLAGSGICPCCMWEPGFDDAPPASAAAEDTILGSLRAYRAAWRVGTEWRGKAGGRPQDWDGAGQLAYLFSIAPHVR